MPFDRPELAELTEQQRASIKSRLSLTSAVLRRSAADIFALVQAGGLHEVYGSLDRLALQLFVDTCDRDQLIRIASFYGLSPDPATFASGFVTATGVDPTLIPEGTAFIYQANGARYLSTADATMSGGTVTFTVQAEVAGEVGNIPPTVGFDPQTLEIETPIAGVNDTVGIDGTEGIFGGNDEQGKESFRAEVLALLASSPAGGNDDDYEIWSKEVAGVTRVWVFGNNPLLGQVTVVFVRDGDDPIIPDGAEVAAVQAYLDTKRPTTAEVIVQAPTEVVVPYTISITPDTAANRTAVEAELDDLHRTLEAGDGAGRGTLYLFQVNAAIGRVPLTTATVTLPPADVVPAEFELLTRGSVTWA